MKLKDFDFRLWHKPNLIKHRKEIKAYKKYLQETKEQK